METICFTATARIRRPQDKIVYFDDYRKALTKPSAVPSALRQAAKSRTLRRRLELICLWLEAGVCVSMLLLTLTATVHFFVS